MQLPYYMACNKAIALYISMKTQKLHSTLIIALAVHLNHFSKMIERKTSLTNTTVNQLISFADTW